MREEFPSYGVNIVVDLEVLVRRLHRKILDRLFNREDYSDNIARYLQEDRSDTRDAVKELEKARLIEVRKKEGPRKIIYGLTYTGGRILRILWEMERVARKRPSKFARRKEITQILDLLNREDKLSRKTGLKLLFHLGSQGKDVLHDPRVLDFFMRALDDPSWDELSEYLLECFAYCVMGKPRPRKIPKNINLEVLKKHILHGRTDFCTLHAFTITRWLDEKVAVNRVIDMVKEDELGVDKFHRIYPGMRTEVKELLPSRREQLGKKLIDLALDPRESVRKKAMIALDWTLV